MAGSFDPFTNGHLALVARGLCLFDEVVVACGNNPAKRYFLSLDARMDVIRASVEGLDGGARAQVTSFQGLLVDFCRSVDAGFILRGLRTQSDFEFERRLGLANRDLCPEIESVFLLAEPQNIFISSSLVKEIFLNGGDVSRYIPPPAHQALKRSAET